MKPKTTIRLCSNLLWGILSVFLVSAAYAQTTKISGTVVSQRTGTPATGATIAVKKTNRIVTANDEGRFTIDASVGEVLVISRVGFINREVTVGTATNIEVRLVESAEALDDVVVVGYGKMKRKDVTGSISSVSGEELRRSQPATFDQALQGKVAGVMVQQISGQPGGGVSIQIRGISSISGSNSPMYVIDGVIIPPTNNPGNGSNPLNTINPSEIESIDVLKDASATAIYGSQATNGVIVITTKRGSVAPPQISYDGYYGSQQIPKRLPTVNLQQLASFINDRSIVWGFDDRPEFANPKYLGTGTNWQDELFRNAPMQNHSIAVNGGDARTQYLLSLGYFDQDGIARGSRFKRHSVRLNLDNKTTDWLKIGTSLQLANVVENVNSSSAGVIGHSINLTPDIPVKILMAPGVVLPILQDGCSQ